MTTSRKTCFHLICSASLSLFAALPATCQAAAADPLGYQATHRGDNRHPAAAAPHAMVVSAQHLATDAGVEILRAGGNAVDAAVAVGYALAVVYPAAGNIGGGGFATIRLPDGQTHFIDFREHAPLAATSTMYQDKDGNVDKAASVEGWRAVGVPGTVAGLDALERKWGRLGLTRVMAPAIRLAEEGFHLQVDDVDLLNSAKDRLARDSYAKKIFLNPNGSALEVGDTLVQKDLANTLRRIAQLGDKGFYEGETAQEIVAASRRGGGILSLKDFTSYKIRALEPLHCNYKGYRIDTAPPPSGGGVAICEILNILSAYDLKKIGLRSVAGVQLQTEAMRHAYSDRRDLGDPAFVKNPVAHLIDPSYAAAIRAGFRQDHAIDSASLRPGEALPQGDAPVTEPAHEKHETTQFCAADRSGIAVSVTYTLNGWYGAHVVGGRTGIVMNDEMDDFSVKPGVPNMYGIVGSRANEIAPGKTPLSSMSPTIISKDGKLVMAIGSPGGSRIPTIILNVVLGVIDGGMDIQQAINQPRIHEQWMPRALEVEPGALTSHVSTVLRGRGYQITEQPQYWGLAQGILFGRPRLDAPVTGFVYGGSDQRHAGGLARGL
ncbi:Glutathione hydrolase proenzyme [Acetobacteraceae bacterium EV16G]